VALEAPPEVIQALLGELALLTARRQEQRGRGAGDQAARHLASPPQAEGSGAVAPASPPPASLALSEPADIAPVQVSESAPSAPTSAGPSAGANAIAAPARQSQSMPAAPRQASASLGLAVAAAAPPSSPATDLVAAAAAAAALAQLSAEDAQAQMTPELSDFLMTLGCYHHAPALVAAGVTTLAAAATLRQRPALLTALRLPPADAAVLIAAAARLAPARDAPPPAHASPAGATAPAWTTAPASRGRTALPPLATVMAALSSSSPPPAPSMSSSAVSAPSAHPPAGRGGAALGAWSAVQAGRRRHADVQAAVAAAVETSAARAAAVGSASPHARGGGAPQTPASDELLVRRAPRVPPRPVDVAPPPLSVGGMGSDEDEELPLPRE
jgi:hypothetical protein